MGKFKEMSIREGLHFAVVGNRRSPSRCLPFRRICAEKMVELFMVMFMNLQKEGTFIIQWRQKDISLCN